MSARGARLLRPLAQRWWRRSTWDIHAGLMRLYRLSPNAATPEQLRHIGFTQKGYRSSAPKVRHAP